MSTLSRTLLIASLGCISSAARAQTFVIQAPGVSAAQQNFESYQGDFGDIDRDGDADMGLAAYGTSNRLWLNSGGLQGGTAGTFSDGTAARFPSVTNNYARDLDFVDLDFDGDLDLFSAHDSGGANNPSRWWINMGGLQAGTEGFFQDQTAARWLDLNAGNTSIAASLLHGGGGFIDWSWDGEFGDLDHDGDLDLFHTSFGQGLGLVPTRIFLNDGTGAFREFNPSGFRLTGANIATNDPGLWCEGTHAPNTTSSNGSNCDVASNTFESELADFDGDFDLDFQQGGQPDKPRYFKNRINENAGVLTFRDVTSAVFPASYAAQGGYGQGVADLDNDGDIDIYGLNWAMSLNDHVLVNNGAGVFTIGSLVPLSNEDEEDADFFDYDNDGDLDVLLAGYSGGQELYRNELGGAGSFTKQSTLIQTDTLVAFDNDLADADLDGDVDFIVANSSNPGCHYFRNTSQIGDTFAPTIPALEQAPNRNASATPTSVRTHVLDNISDYVVAAYAVELEYSVNGSAFASTPMRWSGAQLFRGEIPGQVSGAIAYRVRATDHSGNVGLSSSKNFVSSGWASYCTAGTSSNGCTGTMSASGTPSASAASGFTLIASSLEGQKPALIFYGVNGRIAQPWGASSSFLCVKAPAQRMGTSTASGTVNACNGAVSIDWNAWIAVNPTAHGQPFSAGDIVVAQCWYRDPASAKTTALTDALEFAVAP